MNVYLRLVSVLEGRQRLRVLGRAIPLFNRLAVISTFYRAVGVEAALGVIVLLAAAVLVFLQPAREHPTGMTKAHTLDSTVMQGRR
jgi:hypothetical protein